MTQQAHVTPKRRIAVHGTFTSIQSCPPRSAVHVESFLAIYGRARSWLPGSDAPVLICCAFGCEIQGRHVLLCRSLPLTLSGLTWPPPFSGRRETRTGGKCDDKSCVASGPRLIDCQSRDAGLLPAVMQVSAEVQGGQPKALSCVVRFPKQPTLWRELVGSGSRKPAEG